MISRPCCNALNEMVARGGIEPPTQGFSGPDLKEIKSRLRELIRRPKPMEIDALSCWDFFETYKLALSFVR